MRLKTDLAVTDTSILWYIRIKVLTLVWLLPSSESHTSYIAHFFKLKNNFSLTLIWEIFVICSLEILLMYEDEQKGHDNSVKKMQ